MNIKIDRDNINEYYDKINKLIDTYNDWKIKPSALKNFLKPGSKGLKTFIESNKLDTIEGIERVIQDVVEDRTSIELDTVMTFESFLFNQKEEVNVIDKLFIGIEKSDIKYEKVLSDQYKISLSHVKEEDTSKHLYIIDDMGLVHSCLVLSKDDVIKVKENLVNLSYDLLVRNEVEVKELNLDINLSGLISKEFYIESFSKRIDTLDMKSWIGDIFNYKFMFEKGDYYIWHQN